MSCSSESTQNSKERRKKLCQGQMVLYQVDNETSWPIHFIAYETAYKITLVRIPYLSWLKAILSYICVLTVGDGEPIISLLQQGYVCRDMRWYRIPMDVLLGQTELNSPCFSLLYTCNNLAIFISNQKCSSKIHRFFKERIHGEVLLLASWMKDKTAAGILWFD